MEAYKLLVSELAASVAAALYILGFIDGNVLVALLVLAAAGPLSEYRGAAPALLAASSFAAHLALGCWHCSLLALLLLFPLAYYSLPGRPKLVLALQARAQQGWPSAVEAASLLYSSLVLLSVGCAWALAIPLLLVLLLLLPSTGLLYAIRRDKPPGHLEQVFFVLLAASLASFARRSLVRAAALVGGEARKLFENTYWSMYLVWRRDVVYGFKEPLDALREAARRSKARIISDLVEGYSIVALSGGDEKTYLENKTSHMLSELESSWSLQTRTLLVLSEVGFIVSVLAPLLSILSSLVSLGRETVLYGSLAFSLFLDVVIVLAADSVGVPRSSEPTRLPHAALSAPAALSAVAASKLLALPLHAAVPLVAVLSTAPIAYDSAASHIDAERQSRLMEKLLRGVVEIARGSTPGLHVLRLLGWETREVSSASMCIESGCGISDAVDSSGLASKQSRLAFYTLLKVLELGGSLEALDKLAGLYSRLVSAARRSLRELALALPLAVIAPVIGFSSVNLVASLAPLASGVPGMLPAASPGLAMLGEAKLAMSVMLTGYSLTLPKVVSGSVKSQHIAVPALVAVLASSIVF